MAHRSKWIIVSIAVLSLTPLVPTSLKRPDFLLVRAFQPLDWIYRGVSVLWEKGEATGGNVGDLPPAAVADLEAWNQALQSGVRKFAPHEQGVLARIVDLDPVQRLLLIDAGAGMGMRPGDAVVAGDYVVGRIRQSTDGLAVVETPWTPNAHFAGSVAAADRGGAVRFVLEGLDSRSWEARVSIPEAAGRLYEEMEVVSPVVDDILPESVPRAPPGFKMAVLVRDTDPAFRHTETFVARPKLDLRLLDAVVVLSHQAHAEVLSETFVRHDVGELLCGIASPGRDGAILLGGGIQNGAAVVRGHGFVGNVTGSGLGAAKVRGVLDPDQTVLWLVMGEDNPAPLLARIQSFRQGTARVAKVLGPYQPAVGDLLLTSGRGIHTPRGMVVGTVVRADDEEFEVQALKSGDGPPVQVVDRSSAPTDLWNLKP